MKLYEFTPQKDTKKLSSISGVLFIGAILIMLCTIIFGGMAFRWVFQLTALGMFTAAIFITTRYVMKSFVYRIESSDNTEDENSSPDLTVTEIQNRHTITVCRLALSGIEETVILTPDNKATASDLKQRIKSEHRKFYNYCADFMPQKQICILVTECGEKLAVYLSYDEELERIFMGK